jgi:ABC-2 type transport system permease protein
MTAAQDARLARLAAEPMLPAGRPVGVMSGATHSLRDVWEQRQLLGLLVRRELKARYKDSTLGFVWSLLKPLALLIVYYVAIGKFLGGAKAAPDYAVFIYCGLTIWSLFSEILASCTGSILANAGLVKKIYLPREVFPLSTIGSALFNFGIQLLVLIAATIVVGAPPTGTRLGYAVLALALVLVIGTALGLLLAAVNVYLRDVQYLVEIMLMFLMWTAPVVYEWGLVDRTLGAGSWLMNLYQLNPLTLAVEAFQRAFWVRGSALPQPPHLATSILIEIAFGIGLLWICQRVFARLQDNFAQEL